MTTASPCRLRVGDAFEAGDAVVDREQHVGRVRQREVDDRRREAVAVHAPVGHDVAERRPGRRRASPGRAAGRRRRSRRRSRSRRRRRCATPAPMASASRLAASLGAEQAGRRQQARQGVVELVGGADAARGEQARQQRVHAGLLEGPGGARRDVAVDEAGARRHGGAHRAASTSCGRALLPGAAQALPERLGRGLEARGVAFAAERQRHRVAVPRPCRERGQRAGVEAAPGLGPRRPVAGQQRRAQVACDVGRRAGASTGWRRPQPLSQNELIGSTPRSSRASLTGVGVEQQLRLALQAADQACVPRCGAGSARRSRAASGRRCGRRRGRATPSAKPSRSSRPTYQRSAAPQAVRKPSLSNSGRGGPRRGRATRSSSSSSACRVEEDHVVAAELPVGSASAAPRRDRRCRRRRPAAACAAKGRAPSPPCQPRAAASTRSCGGEKLSRSPSSRPAGASRAEQALEVRQREVAQHVPAGFRVVGSEGNEQVHAAIIRAALQPAAAEVARVASAAA